MSFKSELVTDALLTSGFEEVTDKFLRLMELRQTKALYGQFERAVSAGKRDGG